MARHLALARTASWLTARETRLWTALFAACAAAYAATIPLPRVDGMLIGSDGVRYYMYVRSLLIDHDIDFANEYRVLRPQIDPATQITPTGRIRNSRAVGPAILWAPFFATGHVLSLLLRRAGWDVSVDGYGFVYQAAICMGSIVYGLSALILTTHTVRRYYPRTAPAAALLTLGATNVIYYLLVEPSMSHMCSLFAVAALIGVWIGARPLSGLRQCFQVGLIGGVVAIVRQPDATLVLLPLLDWLIVSRVPLRTRLKGAAALAAGFVLVFSLQMMTWQILHGGPFSMGYRSRFRWSSPHFADVLFSTEHGLFLWHPVLLIATAGFALLWRRDRVLTALLLGGFLSQAYVIGSWAVWSQGDAFGGRMFIASLPLLTLGLGAALDWLRARRLARVTRIGATALVLWNALFLLQYRLGYITMGGPYGVAELTTGKLTMLADLAQRFHDCVGRAW